MYKLVSVLALCSLVATCHSLDYTQDFDLFTLSDSYEQINEHLSSNVESEDLETNMNEARRWLDEEVSKSSDKRLASALELLTSLATVASCNRESFEIVEANDYLTNHQAHDIGKGSAEETRVVKIVAHYATLQAEKCIKTYAKKIHQRYRTLKGLNTERVHQIADKLTWQPSKNHGVIVYDVIKQLAGGSHDATYLTMNSNERGPLNEEKLAELYRKYLVEPCKEFVGINSNKLLETIQYYEQWAQVDKSDELLSKLPYRFRVCDRLASSDYGVMFRKFRDVAMSQ